jgi:hypothetical protein
MIAFDRSFVAHRPEPLVFRWRRRSGHRQQRQLGLNGRRVGFASEAGQYLLNYGWVFNASDGRSCASMRSRHSCVPAHHLHGALAVATHFNLNTEHPLQSLRPGYCHGWHVCRFCRSKNRPWLRAFRCSFCRRVARSWWPCPLFSLTPCHAG